MKRFIGVVAFIVFSFILVERSPAPPLPGSGVPVGGSIPTPVAIAFIAAYGVWRMRK